MFIAGMTCDDVRGVQRRVKRVAHKITQLCFLSQPSFVTSDVWIIPNGRNGIKFVIIDADGSVLFSFARPVAPAP
jgi:hypothetical protein